MTTDTLPPLTDEDDDDIASVLIAEVWSTPELRPAVNVVHETLSQPVADWQPWLYVTAALNGWDELIAHTFGRKTAEARFVTDEWVQRNMPLPPHARVFSVALVADQLLEERVRTVMAEVDERDAADLDRWDRDAHLVGIGIGVLLTVLLLGLFYLFAAQQAGAATLQPDYPTAPGHEPSISVACDGDHVIAAVHPWDRGRRNFQVWDGGALLANVNEGQWSGRFKTVSHVVYSGTRYDVRHDDCVAPTTTTTAPVPTTTSTTTPATTTTEPQPSTTTTAQPATSLPPATSTSVLSTASTITTHATTPATTIPAPATPDAGPVPSTVPSPVDAPAGELPRTGSDWRLLATIAVTLGLLGVGLWALGDWYDDQR